jgi:DNA repair protein RadA
MAKIEKISDLPGVGPAAEEKLIAGGFASLEAIAVASPGELSTTAGFGEASARKIIQAAREAMNIGFETAKETLAKRERMHRITTGSKAIDDLLGGGLESQSITEVYGRFGSGKTQWAFQVCVTVQLPKDQGGVDGKVIYIDSENSFRPERITSIAKRYNLDPEECLKNIMVGRAYNADHQMLLADKAKEKMEEDPNVKLLIVDSLTAHFRAEFTGRGQLADRQQKLNRHMYMLMKLAESKNVAVLVTNQVMDRPDVLFGDPTAPIGGNIVGHASKTRLYLRKGKGETHIAKLVDSPYLPDGEAIYKVTPEGIIDE